MYISSFLNYIRFEKRYSPHTVISYENDLNQFLTYLKTIYQNIDIINVDSYQIRSYIVDLMDKGNSASSIKRKLSVLNSFYKYQIRNEKIDKSPMTGISAPKQSKRLPSFITEGEVKNLAIKSTEDPSFENYRDDLIINMLYSTGIRRSELINLKDDSIDESRSEIKVLGKRNKERLIPVSEQLIRDINEYQKVRDSVISAKSDHIFVTSTGKKMYPKLVYNIVKKCLSEVTTQQNKGPHVLRHTFATHLLNNGADINAIKDLLGHSNLASTQVYTHNTIEKLKNVHKQAHPKS